DARAGLERPAVFEHAPVHDRDRHQRLQSLERAHDQGAMRPRAGIADIQAIAAGLGTMPALPGRTRTAVGAEPVAEAGLLALEAAVGVVIPAVVPLAFDQQAHALLLFPAPYSVNRRAGVSDHASASLLPTAAGCPLPSSTSTRWLPGSSTRPSKCGPRKVTCLRMPARRPLGSGRRSPGRTSTTPSPPWP